MTYTKNATFHCILTESERLAIVNALAYYLEAHGGMDADRRDEFKLAFKEDGAALVDRLADKVAQLY